jgi:hypothetical protein
LLAGTCGAEASQRSRQQLVEVGADHGKANSTSFHNLYC